MNNKSEESTKASGNEPTDPVIKEQWVKAKKNLEEKMNSFNKLKEKFNSMEDELNDLKENLRINVDFLSKHVSPDDTNQSLRAEEKEKENLKTSNDLYEKIRTMNLAVGDKSKALSDLADDIVNLEKEIQQAQAEVQAFALASDNTIIGRAKNTLGNFVLNQKLSAITIEPDDDNESVASSDASTVVEGFVQRDRTSSTDTTDTSKDDHILSSAEQQFKRTIADIQKSKKEFNDLYAGILDIGYQLNGQELFTQEDIDTKNTLYEDCLAESKKDVIPATENNPDELKNKFGAALGYSLWMLNKQKTQLKLAEERVNTLNPTTPLGRFFHGLNKAIRRPFGGKTPLEQAQKQLEQTQKNRDDMLKEINIKIKSEKEQLSTKQELLKLLSKQTQAKETMSKIAQQYGISDNSNLSQLHDQVNSVFKNQIEAQNRLSADNKNVKAELIKRSDVSIVSYWFNSAQATAVKNNLKHFLERPTQTNLKTLNESIKKIEESKDKNKNSNAQPLDDPLTILINEAKVLYPSIEIAPMGNMNMGEIIKYFETKMVPLEDAVSTLKDEKKSLQQSIEQKKQTILPIQNKVQGNLLALETCHTLLFIAKQRVDEFLKDKEERALSSAKQLVTYLESKITQITQQLPKQEQKNIDDILKRDRFIPKIDYEVCREDIKKIFIAEGIETPTEPMTQKTIEALCETKPDDAKAILRKINSLSGIDKQVDSLVKEQFFEIATISNLIKAHQGIQDEVYNESIQLKTRIDNNLINNQAVVEDINKELDKFYDNINQNPDNFQTALMELEASLLPHKEECFGVLEDMFRQIDKFKNNFDPIDKMISPLKPITADEIKSFGETHESITSGLKRIDDIDKTLGGLNRHLETSKTIRNNYINLAASQENTKKNNPEPSSSRAKEKSDPVASSSLANTTGVFQAFKRLYTGEIKPEPKDEGVNDKPSTPSL